MPDREGLLAWVNAQPSPKPKVFVIMRDEVENICSRPRPSSRAYRLCAI